MLSVLLNLNKEAKINLTKIGINELYICSIAKTNRFGLVTIILFLSFVLFFLKLSKLKCQQSLEIFRYQFQESSLNLVSIVCK